MNSSMVKITEIPNPPSDTISEIQFSPTLPLFITSSWDSSLNLYNLNGLISSLKHTNPLLTCCFSKDTQSHCFTGSADGTLQFIDLEKNIMNSIKAHSDGIKSIRSFQNTIITGSWDKTIKFYDTRSAQCTKTINLEGKVYCMDIDKNMIAYGLSTNVIYSAPIDNIERTKKHQPKINYMLKSISCLDKYILVGGIDGKCELINTSVYYSSTPFRSHRKDSKVHSVNTVAMYPTNHNILATGGSNGEIIFYDNLSKIKTYTKTEDNAITSNTFSPDGKYYLYSTGEDWSKGYTGEFKRTYLKAIEVSSMGLKV